MELLILIGALCMVAGLFKERYDLFMGGWVLAFVGLGILEKLPILIGIGALMGVIILLRVVFRWLLVKTKRGEDE